MKLPMLYREFARFYDGLNAKSRADEVRFIGRAIRKHRRVKGKELLDVCSGTGTYDALLKRDFNITGVDASREMVAIARRKVPGARYSIGRMQDFRLGKRFDAVLCRGSMDYNFSYAELARTLSNLRRHLKEGGVMIFTLENCMENFRDGRSYFREASLGNDRLIEINMERARKGHDFYDLDVVYVLWKGGRMRVFEDPDRQGLFSIARVAKMLERLGLDATVYSGFGWTKWHRGSSGKPVFVAVTKS